MKIHLRESSLRRSKPWRLATAILLPAAALLLGAGRAAAQPETLRDGGRGGTPIPGAEIVIVDLNADPTSQGYFGGHWTATGINHEGRPIHMASTVLDDVDAIVPMETFTRLPLRDKDDKNFRYAGPAGVLEFNPKDDGEKSNGTFAVEPDDRFREGVQRLYGRAPAADQWFKLIISRAELGDLDLISDSTRPRAGLDDAIRLLANGVPAEYVAGLYDAGRPLSVREIIRLRRDRDDRRRGGPRRPDVPPKGPFSADDLIRLRNAGIAPAYIDVFNTTVGPVYSVDDIVALRNSGVTPEYLQAVRVAGGREYPPREIMALRNAGVPADFVLAAQRSGSFSVDEMIMMRNMRVSPDYFDAARGWSPRPLTANEYVQLHNRGVSAEYLSGLRRTGHMYPADEVIRLKDSGVPLDYITSIDPPGSPSHTAPDIIRLYGRRDFPGRGGDNGRGRPPFDSRGNR